MASADPLQVPTEDASASKQKEHHSEKKKHHHRSKHDKGSDHAAVADTSAVDGSQQDKQHGSKHHQRHHKRDSKHRSRDDEAGEDKHQSKHKEHKKGSHHADLKDAKKKPHDPASQEISLGFEKEEPAKDGPFQATPWSLPPVPKAAMEAEGGRQFIPIEPFAPNLPETRALTPKKPITVVCYICGREYGTKSINIHEPKCLENWHRINNELPKKQRKPTPKRPKFKTEKIENLDHLDAYNEVARKLSDTNARVECNICGRKFAHDRLETHERVCKGEKTEDADLVV